jgi:zinc transport system ATP-binding protein
LGCNVNEANLLDVRDLTVSYQDTVALDSVTFAVAAGDYVGVVGPNGSGKTTLIKAILRLTGYVKGEITLFGQPQQRFTAWQRIGYLPQATPLPLEGFPATVREVVASGCLAGKRFPRRLNRADWAAVSRALQLVGLEALEKQLIGRLSGGQRQRALLARTLVLEPELLVLDEPTAALDPTFRETFYQTLQTLNRQRGATILLITHDTDTIARHATKLLYLDGRVVYFGSVADCGHWDFHRGDQFHRHLQLRSGT